jgi:hypothetical protein
MISLKHFGNTVICRDPLSLAFPLNEKPQERLLDDESEY